MERPISGECTPQPAARPSSTLPTWVAPLARWGYGAIGVVYLTVGLLALLAALRAGGPPTDAQGAFEKMLAQPLGQLLLSAVALGLVGYALWRLVQAIWDPEPQGRGVSGVLRRVGYAGSGVVYAGLALSAGQHILGSGAGENSDTASQAWTARLLAQPFGPWVIGTVRLAMLGYACAQVYRAVTAKFREPLKSQEMSARMVTWVTSLGRVGFIARGVVFASIGLFLIEAAWHADPKEARGLGGALRTLERQPFGLWVLGAVAVGLMCYGLYMVVLARYRRVRL
jgi:Domain of Unknown Function (DUF1206)